MNAKAEWAGSMRDRLERGAMILTLERVNPEARGIGFAARRVLDWELFSLEIAQCDEELREIMAGCAQ